MSKLESLIGKFFGKRFERKVLSQFESEILLGRHYNGLPVEIPEDSGRADALKKELEYKLKAYKLRGGK